MVKHGRNKKRRSGRIGRTKLKNRNYAKFKPPQIKCAITRAHWNPRKSAAENLKNLGLTDLRSNNNNTATNKNINNNIREKEQQEMIILSSPTDSNRVYTSNTDEDSKEQEQQSETCKFVEAYNNTNCSISNNKKKRHFMSMSIEDQKYIVSCLTKYSKEGEIDYTVIVRDIKVNTMQYTENQLKKLCTKFLQLPEKQRKVPIPESLAGLIES